MAWNPRLSVPNYHRLSGVIVLKHHSTSHLGTEWLLSFWITWARSLVQKIKRRCCECRKLYGSPMWCQKMANHSPESCFPEQLPFTNTGVSRAYGGAKYTLPEGCWSPWLTPVLRCLMRFFTPRFVLLRLLWIVNPSPSAAVTSVMILHYPHYLLLVKSDSNLPWGDCHDGDTYWKRWRQVQHFSDQYWGRWLKEYLPEL